MMAEKFAELARDSLLQYFTGAHRAHQTVKGMFTLFDFYGRKFKIL